MKLRMKKNSKKYHKILKTEQKKKRKMTGSLTKRKILTLKRNKMKTHSWLKDSNSLARLSSTTIIIITLQERNNLHHRHVSFHLSILEIQSVPISLIMKTQLKVQFCQCSTWESNLTLRQLLKLSQVA